MRAGVLPLTLKRQRNLLAEFAHPAHLLGGHAHHQRIRLDVFVNHRTGSYKGKFTNWVDYLSIEKKYYDIVMCKKKVNEYLKKYPELKKINYDLTYICNYLCELDSMFPPYDLWCDYYNVNDLKELIMIKKSKILINL